MKIPLLVAAACLMLAGCSTVEVTSDVSIDPRHLHHIYVLTAANDNNHVDQTIVQELQRLGYDASAGPRTMAPDDTEAVIDYQAEWDWDFRMYMLRLTLTVRNARTEVRMAGSHVFHPGVTRKTPAQLVHAALAPIFGPK